MNQFRASNGTIVERHGVDSLTVDIEPENRTALSPTRLAMAGAYVQALREYFATEPTWQPWDEAKPGEIWAITLHGRERPCRALNPTYSDHSIAFLPLDETSPTWFVASAAVTAGRRLWPEDVA